jgi:hypothetical protein
VPFTSLKNVVQIAFFPQRPLIYDCICFCILVCLEKFCYFRVKLCYVRKIFFNFRKKLSYFGKNFWYVVKFLGKNVKMSGKHFGMSGNFSRRPPPPSRRQHFREKFLGALFIRKVPPESLPCFVRPGADPDRCQRCEYIGQN